MQKKWIIALICAGLILTACGSGASSTSVPTEVIATAASALNSLPPDVALNVQNQVSQILNVSVENLNLESIEPKDWPNGCLGLPQEAEVCTEAITPGWLLVFNVSGQQYRFRIDKTGTIVRQEP